MGKYVDRRIGEYWQWIAVALFLLVTVDLLTTLYAVAVVGIGAEANPAMAWLLGQPLAVLVVVHIGVAVLACGFFYALMEMLRRTPEPYERYFAYAVELWLGLLVAAGLVVFANNVAVIVFGESLL